MSGSKVQGWMEALLVALLPERDRETVAGDLQEEFGAREARHGRVRAGWWYARQVVSFGPSRVRTMFAQRPVLAWLCCFTGLSGLWLGAMDAVLRHAGWAGREWIAGAIAGQALLTLLALFAPGMRGLRMAAMVGTAAIFWLGVRALVFALHGAHFEGYVLLIALGLLVQGALTLWTLPRAGQDGRTAVRS